MEGALVPCDCVEVIETLIAPLLMGSLAPCMAANTKKNMKGSQKPSRSLGVLKLSNYGTIVWTCLV